MPRNSLNVLLLLSIKILWILDWKTNNMVVVNLAMMMSAIVYQSLFHNDVLLVLMDGLVLSWVLLVDFLFEGEIVLAVITWASLERSWSFFVEITFSFWYFKIVVNYMIYLLWLCILSIYFFWILMHVKDSLSQSGLVTLILIVYAVLLNWFSLSTVNWMAD